MIGMPSSKTNPGTLDEVLPFFLVVIAVVYSGVVCRLDALVLAAGAGLICYGLRLSLVNSLFVVAAAAFLGSFMPFGSDEHVHIFHTHEGFANQKVAVTDEESEEEEEFENKEDSDDASNEEKEEFKDDEEEEESSNGGSEGSEGSSSEGFESGPSKKKKSKKVAPPPDNGSRAEALELGKKYNMPSEDDDEDYHLDAGTTFMNAYKSLKPDQISAMTKDTQELIATQKQLMSTLSTLKPLITDGKQMMDTFQNYFGGQGLEGMGDLSKMAEKFIGK